MSTLTQEEQNKLSQFLETRHLSKGKGTIESACSIASINLALNGKLTDAIPDCMSEVIGVWIIVVQDFCPTTVRNSLEWKRLLPLAAGTGREHEKQRLDILYDWLWHDIVPHVDPPKHKTTWDRFVKGELNKQELKDFCFNIAEYFYLSKLVRGLRNAGRSCNENNYNASELAGILADTATAAVPLIYTVSNPLKPIDTLRQLIEISKPST